MTSASPTPSSNWVPTEADRSPHLDRRVASDQAWEALSEAEIDGLTVPFLSRQDLILNKRAAGRLQDVADVATLEADDESPGGESNS